MARSFTEIQPPSSRFKFALIPSWIPDELFCSHVEIKRGEPRACRTDSFNGHHPCGVCGAYYCRVHISEKTIGGTQEGAYAVCLSCAKLTRDEQEQVIDLRKAIEKG